MTDRNDDRFASDDERLSALIDGALDAAETRRLEARLAEEPALARRLAALREADRVVREAYGAIADEPLGAQIRALLEPDAATGGAAATGALPGAADAPGGSFARSADVVPFRRRVRAPAFWVPASLAAGIALAVGIWVGTAPGPRDGLTDIERLLASRAPIGPGSELHEVIESMPSGETATLAGNLSATPRLTFRTADGGFCREIALSSESRQTALVGCRENGSWVPEAVIEVPGMPDANGNNEFVPASGPATELDAIVDALMDGVPLSGAAEREAITAGWR